ncbi:carboxypeptidase-like regulatory domain-containing protein, partial [Pedobacter sp.]|uniref:carboxypeptidase-like regulatory domain-containing protein n=1 Tax=Pedobacter sp. TaxID=1411316 RepID=UPI003D7FA23B
MKKNFIKLIKPGPAFFAGSVLIGLGFNTLDAQAINVVITSSIVENVRNTKKVDIIVKGVVKDETGQPIPGVSVKIKGANTVVSTDGNGAFTIGVPSATAVLVFTYVGYTPKEVVVGNQTTISVSLQANSTTLENVEVVSVGYGTLPQKEVTSAVTHIPAEKFRQSGSRNP